ncbi:MAG: alkaline phosphatase family protein [Candidatus Woesearchaeota archaeon]
MLPNYQKNSLVNLMSSVIQGCGGKSSYNDLPKLTEEIKFKKNLVLLVIDGMGTDHLAKLKKKNKHSFLANHFSQNLTSVFPSTTTAAITTFFTGRTPQEHGLAAWDMYLDEIKDIGTVLRNTDSCGKPISPGKLKYPSSLLDTITREKHFIQHQQIINTPFTNAYTSKAVKWKIRNFNGLLNKIPLAIKYHRQNSSPKKFIYAYWGDLDYYSHHFGKDHHRTQKHLRDLDRSLGKFFSKFKREDTLVLITADHGHINTPKERSILLSNSLEIVDCLRMPPAGEPRALFCYIKPNKKKDFEKYVKSKLNKYCTLYPSKQLIQKGYFGVSKGKIHPKLLSRLGDYVLILKKNYVFKYVEKGEKVRIHLGNHGGISKDEMIVPLIKFKLDDKH